jgi:hypothetical protein
MCLFCVKSKLPIFLRISQSKGKYESSRESKGYRVYNRIGLSLNRNGHGNVVHQITPVSFSLLCIEIPSGFNIKMPPGIFILYASGLPASCLFS